MNLPEQFLTFIPMYEDVSVLEYATELSSGIDLRAYVKNSSGILSLGPSERIIVETGYKCKINPNFEGQIRSRSGLAAKQGIMVLNSPGTIDADYDGEIKVILFNTSEHTCHIHHGDRIAQFVLSPVIREFSYMPKTFFERGEGGFGSTGVK